VKILSTGIGLPAKRVSNDELSAFLQTSDEWIVSHTGIRSRYICTDESLTDLAAKAASQAMTGAGWTAADVDLVIVSTISGDYVTPSLACRLSERLGFTCPAFDVNAACSGFVYALDVAQLYIDSQKASHILVVSCEELSRHADWSDRASCVLFGDGAGAVALGKGDALRYIKLSADANTAPLYKKSACGNSPFREKKSLEHEYLRMEGQEVFKFAVQTVEKEIGLAIDKLAIRPADVDFFLLHQANRRIIESIRLKLKQPESKFPINIDRYGNMSSATIPVLLHEMLSAGQIETGDVLIMSAFGAGMTHAVCVWFWE
jgi:3-oxoacyl-[acyl-carrier-protein] synthase-3